MATIDSLINLENLDDIINSNDLDKIDLSKFYQEIYGSNNIEENTEKKCPNCNSQDFVEDFSQGFIVCLCGQVICNLFDYRTETKLDDDGKIDNVRCNKITNPLLPSSSLGTRLPYNIRGNLQKLQNWSAMPYRERSLHKDFTKINDCCEKINLKKNIQDDANIFYYNVKSSKYEIGPNIGKFIITRGKNNKSIQAGSIVESCRKNKVPFNAKDICTYYNITIKELNNGVKMVKYFLKNTNISTNFNDISSGLYIKKYCEKYNIKEEYMNEAIKISQNINKLNIATEHNQFSIAATSVLIMAENNNITNMTKKKLRMMFGVSEVTITKTYKKVEKIKKLLSNDEEIEKLLAKINIKNENEEETVNPVILERMKKFGIKPNNDIITDDILLSRGHKDDIISDISTIDTCDDNIKIKIKTSKSDKIVKNDKVDNKTKKIIKKAK